MAKLKLWLSGLLAVQLLIAGGLYWSNQTPVDFSVSEPLVAIDVSTVQRVSLEDGEVSVSLEKSEGVWTFSETGLPVNNEKLMTSLEKLIAVKKGWPVTTTSRSHKRFEVKDDVFVRKIELGLSNGEKETLYLGSSPSYRLVHARQDQKDEVYSVELATHEFSVKKEDWLDTALLSVSEVQKVKGSDFELQKNNDVWTFIQSSVVEEVSPEIDSSKVNELSTWFESLNVLGVAGSDVEVNQGTEIVVTESDNTWTYHFFKHADKAYVQRNDRNTIFEIAVADYDKFSQTNLKYFAMEKSEEASELKESTDLSLN